MKISFYQNICFFLSFIPNYIIFFIKSSPVTLRRSGQQVRLPIHPSPSAATVLHPGGHPSGAVPVHPSLGGTLQEHEVFQQGLDLVDHSRVAGFFTFLHIRMQGFITGWVRERLKSVSQVQSQSLCRG